MASALPYRQDRVQVQILFEGIEGALVHLGWNITLITLMIRVMTDCYVLLKVDLQRSRDQEEKLFWESGAATLSCLSQTG